MRKTITLVYDDERLTIEGSCQDHSENGIWINKGTKSFTGYSARAIYDALTNENSIHAIGIKPSKSIGTGDILKNLEEYKLLAPFNKQYVADMDTAIRAIKKLREEEEKKQTPKRIMNSLYGTDFIKDLYPNKWPIDTELERRAFEVAKSATETHSEYSDAWKALQKASMSAKTINDVFKEYVKQDNERTKQIYMKRYMNIKDVIFNDPATIVFWADGSKTVVKAEGEAFDPEKGLAMAISKKALGNDRDYYETFKKWVGKYNKKLEKERKNEKNN